MLLAVMLMSVAILGGTSVVGLIMVYEIRHTADVISSAQAVFAADSGIECALYRASHLDSTIECNSPAPSEYYDFANGANYRVEYLCGDAGIQVGARSYGESRKTHRAFEGILPGSGGGTPHTCT